MDGMEIVVQQSVRLLFIYFKDDRNNIDSIIRTKSVGDATAYEKFTCYDGTKNFTWASRIGRNQQHLMIILI